jgi:FtsH-binding integral membrane protein
MSYGLEYRSLAAEAAPSERAAFIRQTYAHLAAAILLFAGLETFLVNLPGAGELSLSLLGTSRFSWLIVLVAFMGVSYLANKWARSDTSLLLQYLGLGLYVVAQAVIFLPLLFLADKYFPDDHIILTAGVLTLAIFLGLSSVVLVTRRDFSFLRTYLMVGSFIALGVIVAGIFLPAIGLGLVFCFFMVALSCGYIIFQTSNLLHQYRTDQPVAAALALFASVALLFWYIVQILMIRRR